MSRRSPFLISAVAAALLYLAALVALTVADPGQIDSVAPLRLKAATPLLGTCGQDLALTLTGSGFDDQTRVSLALDVVNSDARLATMETWANLHDVAVAGNRAYLANSYRGVQVADISNPLQPRIVGSLATSRAWAVDVQGTTAYLADAKEGLLVIDVADEAAPRLLATAEVPGVALELTVRGEAVYLCAGPGGLLTFDAAAPGAPRIASSITEYPAWDFDLAGDLALLATSRGVQVLTLDEPKRPQLLSRFDTSGRVYAVAAAGRWGFFIDAERRFGVIDFSDPRHPVLAGMTPVPVAASEIVVAGDRAYLTGNAGGVVAVAIDNPRRPRILGQFADAGTMQMTVVGDLGFAACSNSGLQVLDLQRLQPLQAIASAGTVGNPRWLAGDGDTVCLSDGSEDVRVVDLSDAKVPRVAAVFAAAGEVAQVVMADGMAYLAAGEAGLQVIDVRDPYRPRSVGVLRTPGTVFGVAVEGEKALVLDHLPPVAGSGGEITRSVRVVDVSDPAAPQVTGALPLSHWVRRAEIVGERGYLAAGKDGLLILDLSDPEEPELVGAATLPWPQQSFSRARDVSVRGETAYLANGPAGLQIVDLGDGQRPQVVGSLDAPGYSKGVAVSGELVYLLNRNRLQVVDVQDPCRPALVGELQLPREAEQVLVEDGRALVAGGRSGLLVLPLPVAGQVVAVGPGRLEVSLPGPELPGRYRLTVHGRDGSAQLSEPIVFSAP